MSAYGPSTEKYEFVGVDSTYTKGGMSYYLVLKYRGKKYTHSIGKNDLEIVRKEYYHPSIVYDPLLDDVYICNSYVFAFYGIFTLGFVLLVYFIIRLVYRDRLNMPYRYLFTNDIGL